MKKTIEKRQVPTIEFYEGFFLNHLEIMAFENIIRCVEVPNEGRPSQLARRSCCPRCVFRRRPPSLDFPAVASVAWAARGGDTGLPGTPRLSFSAHLSLVANGAIVARAR